MVWLISESEVNGMTTTIDRLIRLQEVQSLTGYKRTSIYRLMGQGEFPNAVKLGPRAVGWRESEIVGWIASREPS